MTENEATELAGKLIVATDNALQAIRAQQDHIRILEGDIRGLRSLMASGLEALQLQIDTLHALYAREYAAQESATAVCMMSEPLPFDAPGYSNDLDAEGADR